MQTEVPAAGWVADATVRFGTFKVEAMQDGAVVGGAKPRLAAH